MKRFVFFIGFIALTDAVFSQTWQPSLFEYIQSYPQYQLIEHNNPKAVEMIRTSDTTNPEYQNYFKYLTGDHIYSFVSNKKFYMLSYDTCKSCYGYPSLKQPIKRGIYLFRLDVDKWTKVCYEPVQIDYYSLDSSIDEPNVPQHNIWSSYCYVPVKNITDDYNNDKSLKNGYVTVSGNGEVTIILVNRKWRYDDKYTHTESFENKTIVIVPNIDGTYKVR